MIRANSESDQGLGVSFNLNPSVQKSLLEQRRRFQQGSKLQEEFALETLNASTLRTSLAAANLALACNLTTAPRKSSTSSEEEEGLDESIIHDDVKYVNEEIDDEIIPFIADNPDENSEGSEDSKDSKGNDGFTDNEEEEPEFEQEKYTFDPEEKVQLTGVDSTVPLLLIDLHKLCGYVPESSNERMAIQNSLEHSLLGGPANSGKDSSAIPLGEGDGVSMNFASRSAELFELGQAIHVDTSCLDSAVQLQINDKLLRDYFQGITKIDVNNILNDWHGDVDSLSYSSTFAVIPYPEYLCETQASSDEATIYLTRKLWNILQYPHANPIINRIYTHLRHCNQALLWKYHMYRELHYLAWSEQRQRDYVLKQRQLERWQSHQRAAQLEKLYEVRRVIEQHLEDISAKVRILQQERNERVQESLSSMIGSGMDLAKETFEFLNDSQEPSHITDKLSHKHEDTGSLADVEESSEDERDNEHNHELIHPTPTTHRRRRRRDKAKASSKSKQSELLTMEAQNERKLRIFQKQALLEEYTTVEEKMGVASKLSLEERLQKVDDLLETLQDEEWAKEEKDCEQNSFDNHENDGYYSSDSKTDHVNETSLLDPILAMILGALPSPNVFLHKIDQESFKNYQQLHYQWIKQEHESIKSDWKDYYGRLPSNATIHQKRGDAWGPDEDPSHIKSNKDESNDIKSTDPVEGNTLINNGDVEHWEDHFIDEEEEQRPPTKLAASLAVKPKIGLRPGGKVKANKS